MTPFPFEVDFPELESNLDSYVDSVFETLGSEFLLMPKGPGFLDYERFEAAYENLKRTTHAFQEMDPDTVLRAAVETPIILLVLRAVLGFTPPEWAYIATQHSGITIDHGAARALDRRIRMAPDKHLTAKGVTADRIRALIETACHLIKAGAPEVAPAVLHRLDKADTKFGLQSLRTFAQIGVPYAMVLYERVLGRPFASHRDSVSELVGEVLEAPIAKLLTEAGISFQQTGRAKAIPGFDQAPDFIVPDALAPKIVIEAKVAEDDGTARDKVTRVQHLESLSLKGVTDGRPRFEVIACIGGRGFMIRRERMRGLLLATRGKTFTLQTLDLMVESTGLREYRTR